MSSPIKVTFAELATAQGDIASSASRINSRLDDLRRFLTPLVATWEGAAAVMYQEKQRAWDTAAADINVVLTQIGRAVGEANANYQQTEAANAGRWR